MLIGLTVGALSNGLALVVRKEETLIGAINVAALPAHVPLDGVHAEGADPRLDAARRGRQPGQLGGRGGAHRGLGRRLGRLAVYTGALVALALVCIAFATRAFRAYQRSL